MKEKILNKLMELFISKNKELKPETAKVWVERLMEKYDKPQAEFVTLGKIAYNVDREISLFANELLNNTTSPLSIDIAKKLKINLDHVNSAGVFDRICYRFLDELRERYFSTPKPKELENDYADFIKELADRKQIGGK
jgi:hypothetical protein